MTSPAQQFAAEDTRRSSRIEREAKLDAAPDFVLPHDCRLIDGVMAGGPEQQRLETVYYDTPDLRLASRGITLRYRNSEGWTLKLPEEKRRQALIRTEHRFAGENKAVPSAASDLVQAVVRREQLEPVARLRANRSRVPLRDAEERPLGEIVDDKVSIIENNRSIGTFREVEIELADAAPGRLLRRLVKAMAKLGALPASPAPKLLRALGSRAGDLQPKAIARSRRAPSSGQLVTMALGSSVAELIRRDPAVRLASDPEDVHQARVAVRRLRSDLRTFAPLLEKAWARELRVELGWLGAALGAVRDTDVLLARLQARVQALPEEDREVGSVLVDGLMASAAEKRAELLIVLRSDRYLDLLDRLIEAGQQPRLHDIADVSPAAPLRAARRAWRQLRRAAQSLPAEPNDGDLHALRIQAKRCRYAAESVAPMRDGPARRLARGCRLLQDILGEHHDSVVMRAWLRQAAPAGSSREAFVAGQLEAMERRSGAKARPAWRRVWKRLGAERPGGWLRVR